MREGLRVCGVAPDAVENRREASSLERVPPCPFVREERQLGDEADVGEGQSLADQEAALRKQGSTAPAEIGREPVPGSRLNLGGYGSVEQRQQVRLRIAAENEARIQEAVHARCLVRVAAVERKAPLAEPGNHPHDTVRLEDADGAVG